MAVDYSQLQAGRLSSEQAKNMAELVVTYMSVAPMSNGKYDLTGLANLIQRDGLQAGVDWAKSAGADFRINRGQVKTPYPIAKELVDRLYKDANFSSVSHYQNWLSSAQGSTVDEFLEKWNNAQGQTKQSKLTPEEIETFKTRVEEELPKLIQSDLNNFIQSANKIYQGYDLTPNYGPETDANKLIAERLNQAGWSANQADLDRWNLVAERYGVGAAIAQLDRALALRNLDKAIPKFAQKEGFEGIKLTGQLPSTYLGASTYQDINYAGTTGNPLLKPPTTQEALVPLSSVPATSVNPLVGTGSTTSSGIPIQGVPTPTLPQTSAPTNIPIQGVPTPQIPSTSSFINTALSGQSRLPSLEAATPVTQGPRPTEQPMPQPMPTPSIFSSLPAPQPLVGTVGSQPLVPQPQSPVQQAPQPQMTNEEFIQQQQAPVEMADGGSVGGASSGVRRLKMSGYQDGGDVSNDEYIQEMMTGTLPTDQETNPGILPPEVREAVDVPLDLANLLVRGVAAVPAGGFAGLYKGLTGGKYGTQEGVKEADTEAARVMSKIMGEPKTQAAKDLLEFIGEKAQEYKLDAALPQLLTLPSPGPGSANYVGQQALRSVENTALESMKRITGNPNLSVQDIYRAISEEQLPVSAITKPTASTDLGIKKLEGGLIFPEDETAERLRLKMQRRQAFEEKGKAMPGAPKNARTVIKAPKGSDLPDFVVGDIKPQDWIARTEKMLSPDEIQQYGRWYDDVRGTFLKYTDGDEDLTDKYMRAWLVANQNIGVEGAFNNVLLQAEQFARNVPADQMRAGGLPFATQAARNALQDEPITEGVGLKIADFVDSAEGKGTRSIYGNAREAGAPFVVDIHTARDTGLVDDILLNHLERNGYKVDRNQIKTDLATGPTDTQYENRADFGRNLTQYLNDNNWQGRNDWTPKEIQAIGWMAMTKLTRDAADDTVTALERSLRRLSMEFSPGEGSPWAVKFGDRFNALEPEGQRELTQVATSRAVDMAKQVAGIDLRSVVHGSGGWQKFQNPATVAQTLATKEGSEIAANALGYLLNQTEVWSNAVKGMTKNPKAFAVDFVQKKGDDLSTDQGIMSFWEKVMEADPTGLFVGYQPIRTANNEPGIRVIVDKGGAKRMQDIQAALEGPIAKMIKDSPLDIDARGYENELVKAVNNWKENPDGQLYLARLADLGIGDPATRLNPLRSELETAIESWFSNRAGAAKAGSKAAAPKSSPASASASASASAPTAAAAPAAGGVVPEIGINVASDTKAGTKYADLIVDGQKTLESRDSDSLRPYVGKRVAIVRTGEGKAKAIGAATIGEPMVVNEKQFRELQDQHFVPAGSKFDIKGGKKYLYPIIDAERFDSEQEVGAGIVARKVRAKGTTTAAEDLAAVSSTAPAVSRVEMAHKDVTKRVPELTKGVQDLFAGKISRDEWENIVNTFKPVTAYETVPAPATAKQALQALTKTNRERPGDPTKETYFGVPSKRLKEGDRVGVRLDIPSYTQEEAWVVTVHEPRTNLAAGGAGKRIGYETVAALTDVDFGINPKGSAKIASGDANKSTIATMEGKWKPMSPKEAKALADKYLNDPEWVQVGMDPERHSYFYDRTTMEPVVSAAEVIQIGPLVLAKNVKYANKAEFKYKNGGEVTAFIKAKAR